LFVVWSSFVVVVVAAAAHHKNISVLSSTDVNKTIFLSLMMMNDKITTNN
jgi:hypothetical protein